MKRWRWSIEIGWVPVEIFGTRATYRDGDVGQTVSVPPRVSVAGQHQLDGDIAVLLEGEVGDGHQLQPVDAAVAARTRRRLHLESEWNVVSSIVALRTVPFHTKERLLWSYYTNNSVINVTSLATLYYWL